MPAGATPKREREYEKLKDEFKEGGRYKGREEEVASRIVNKQRARFGETKAAKSKAKQGEAPDKNLPIRNYQRLTAVEVGKKLGRLSNKADLKAIMAYEQSHKNRKGVMQQLGRRLNEM